MADEGAKGSGARALAVVAQARGRFAAMPAARRNSILLSGTALLAVVAGMVWYVGRPDYRVLFSGLDSKDVQSVAQELGAAGIPFQMTSDGSGVQVPAESLDKARMEVASKGMPQSGRLGFELFDKPNWVGSEFDEHVNYQRALEGELEHTIATMGVVRSARVHLVLPQQSLFTSEQKPAKASVVLKLKRAALDPQQTESIRNLVAGAVESLSPGQVTLVDADGRVNLEAHGAGAAANDEARELETRLVAMLEPLAGQGNVRATVNVSYDESTEEHTDEVYDPTLSATLSTQKTEQSSAGSHAAQGVPGTASNTPAAAPAGAVQGSAKAAAPGTPPLLQISPRDGQPVYPQTGGGNGQQVREESGTYAVTRHLTHTELSPGRVKRLTAAVVINDREIVAAGAKAAPATWKPRSSEEMHHLEELAQAAIGFDEKRGDRVVMENVSFSSNVPEPAPSTMEQTLEQAKSLLGTQPAMLKTALTGLLGVMLIVMVLKPVAGQLVATMKEPLQLPAPDADDRRMLRAGMRRADAEDAGSLPSSGDAPRALDEASAEDREAIVFEEVTSHIKREPAHSTRLLEAWISADGDE